MGTALPRHWYPRSHAEGLHRLPWHESTAGRFYQATREIHADLSRTIVVGDLAQRIGMSNSAVFQYATLNSRRYIKCHEDRAGIGNVLFRLYGLEPAFRVERHGRLLIVTDVQHDCPVTEQLRFFN